MGNTNTSENFQNMGSVESKTMQNLVVLMEPSEEADETPLKAGNMILNRFCIDEDASFELSGVNYLKKSPEENEDELHLLHDESVIGKDYSFLTLFWETLENNW